MFLYDDKWRYRLVSRVQREVRNLGIQPADHQKSMKGYLFIVLICVLFLNALLN